MFFRSVLKLAAVKSLEWRNPRQSFEVIRDSLLECKPLNSLLEGHLGGRLLSPAVMKSLVDSKLELLSDDQPTIKGLFVGVKVYAKLLAVGDAVALALNVEDDGVTVVLVPGQTRRNELHELTVLLPDIGVIST